MSKRIFFSILALATFIGYMLYIQPLISLNQAKAAIQQLSNDPYVYAQASYTLAGSAFWLIPALLIALLVGLWGPLVVRVLRKHNILFALPLLLLIGACSTQSEIKTIEANQTAFLIPLVGNTGAQQQFQSIDYLKAKQVASKQVTIPSSWRSTGTTFGIFQSGSFYPDAKLIVIDRSLVSREWTSSAKTGTSPSDQGFGVESVESVGFTVGATCTAIIDEADAATYLYYFGEKPLAEVMDQNVRNYVQGELFNEFGSRTLAQGQVDKKLIFSTVGKDMVDKFKTEGITILSFGGSEGMTYDNKAVQDAIDQSYSASQLVMQAQQDATKQSIDNVRDIAHANAAATATVIAGAAQAEVLRQSGEMIDRYPGLTNYTLAQKSSGQVPQILVMGQGTGQLPFSFMMTAPTQPAPTQSK